MHFAKKKILAPALLKLLGMKERVRKRERERERGIWRWRERERVRYILSRGKRERKTERERERKRERERERERAVSGRARELYISRDVEWIGEYDILTGDETNVHGSACNTISAPGREK